MDLSTETQTAIEFMRANKGNYSEVLQQNGSGKMNTVDVKLLGYSRALLRPELT